MKEYFFQCPYCWEEVSMLVDPSVRQQTYVEDCEVCCNPIELSVTTQEYNIVSVEINELGQ